MFAPNLGAKGLLEETSMSPGPKTRDHYTRQWPGLLDSDQKSKRDEES